MYEQTHKNLSLARLSAQDFRLFESMAEETFIEAQEVVLEYGKRPSHLYFPIRGVLSLCIISDDSRRLELATIGPESIQGLAGLFDLRFANHITICQVDCPCWKIAIEDAKRLLDKSQSFRSICAYASGSRINQICENYTCLWSHQVEQRLAKWILQTRDRVYSDKFYLTQEFLATMLGTSRGTVNAAAGYLADKNLITYSRGNIVILDRLGLEKTSCNCYAKIKEFAEHNAVEPTG